MTVERTGENQQVSEMVACVDLRASGGDLLEGPGIERERDRRNKIEHVSKRSLERRNDGNTKQSNVIFYHVLCPMSAGLWTASAVSESTMTRLQDHFLRGEKKNKNTQGVRKLPVA